jgi:hypothetical protein
MDDAREQLPVRIRYGKWAGGYGAVIALIAHQQIVASWVYTSCPKNPAALVIALASICSAIAIAGGVWSWRVFRSLRDDEQVLLTAKTDRFIAALACALASVIVLFILFSSVAVLFLQCER